MLIFRWFYQQFCMLMNIFNVFEYQYKFELFQNVNISLVLYAFLHVDEYFQHV